MWYRLHSMVRPEIQTLRWILHFTFVDFSKSRCHIQFNKWKQGFGIKVQPVQYAVPFSQKNTGTVKFPVVINSGKWVVEIKQDLKEVWHNEQTIHLTIRTSFSFANWKWHLLEQNQMLDIQLGIYIILYYIFKLILKRTKNDSLYIQWVRKVFRPPYIFHSLLYCSHLLKSFKFIFFPH